MKKYLITLVFIVSLFMPSFIHAENAFFADKVSPDTIGYLRIPNPWSFLADPKGSFLDAVQEDEANKEMIALVKTGIGELFFSNTYKDLEPFSALILNHLASSIEVLLQLPKDAPPQMLKTLISAQLDLSKEDYLFFLDKVREKNQKISIHQDTTHEDFHTLMLPGMPPVVLHFDAPTKRLNMLLSLAGSTKQVLDETLAGLTPAQDHPMHNLEEKIDKKRQGLFVWINLEKIFVFLKPQTMELEKWGLTNARAFALGWGMNNGKGRLKFMLDLPRSAYLSLLPDFDNTLNIKTTNPSAMFFFSLPSSEILAGIKEIARRENNNDLTGAIKEIEETLQKEVGLPLELLLKALGPECVVFSDDTGDFMAVKLGEKENFNQILQMLKEKYGLEHTTYTHNGDTYNHVEFSLSVLQNQDSPPIDPDLLKKISKAHFFWIEEDGFLIFAQVPQALFDRKAASESVPLEHWMLATQKTEFQHSLFNLSLELKGAPRRIYYIYLQMLMILADISGEKINIFDLPTAQKAGIPDTGSYGVKLDIDDPLVSLSLTFENNPLEFLMAGNYTANIAVIGVLSAIAIPNFVKYKDKATCVQVQSEARAAAAALADYFSNPGNTQMPTLASLYALTGYKNSDNIHMELSGTIDNVKITAVPIKGKCSQGSYHLSYPPAADDGWK